MFVDVCGSNLVSPGPPGQRKSLGKKDNLNLDIKYKFLYVQGTSTKLLALQAFSVFS